MVEKYNFILKNFNGKITRIQKWHCQLQYMIPKGKRQLCILTFLKKNSYCKYTQIALKNLNWSKIKYFQWPSLKKKKNEIYFYLKFIICLFGRDQRKYYNKVWLDISKHVTNGHKV